MATSSNTDPGRSTRRTPFEPFRSVPDSFSRYDLTLLAIPIVFLCVLALGTALSVPLRTSVIAASLCGTVLVTDALFVNPPTGE